MPESLSYETPAIHKTDKRRLPKSLIAFIVTGLILLSGVQLLLHYSSSFEIVLVIENERKQKGTEKDGISL